MSSPKSKSSIDQLLLKTDTNDEFIRRMMSSVMLIAKKSNDMPLDADFNYYSMFPEFSASCSDLAKESLVIIQQLCDVATATKTSSGICLSDDLSDSALYDQVIDVVDQLLNDVDVFLHHQSETVIGDNDNKHNESKRLASAVSDAMVLDKDRLLQQQAVEGLAKPQTAFLSEIDNSRSAPFVPRLRSDDPHYQRLRPERLSSAAADNSSNSSMIKANNASTGNPDIYFPQPYLQELVALDYPEWCRESSRRALIPAQKKKQQHASTGSTGPAEDSAESSSSDPQLPQPPDDPISLIDTKEAFDAMLCELTAATAGANSGRPAKGSQPQLPGLTELAVDLEHHSLRSFLGLTCLMQLSTRTKDYVIDTLALRSEVPRLSVLFMNPAVVKVFHGCEKDILWLQRDFGLYILNCFDTFIAAKTLQYPALSLAHLLRIHCGVIADKQHQLADWRQRPLPAEMLAYARTDTRYLLYIYDCLRRELWVNGTSAHSDNDGSSGKEALEHVFFASKKLCMQRYEKPLFDPLGYLSVRQQAQQHRLLDDFKNSAASTTTTATEWDEVQDVSLSALWDWRDRIARAEDDSCAYIMSNAEMLRIARLLPRSLTDLEQCAPLAESSRKHANEIIDLLAEVASTAPAVITAGDKATNRLETRHSIGGSSSVGTVTNPAKFTFSSLASPPIPSVTGSSNSSSSSSSSSSQTLQRGGAPQSQSASILLPASPSPSSTPSLVAAAAAHRAQQKQLHSQQMLLQQSANQPALQHHTQQVSFQNEPLEISSPGDPPSDPKDIFKQAGWNTPAQSLLAADPDLLVHPDSPIDIGELPALGTSHGQSYNYTSAHRTATSSSSAAAGGDQRHQQPLSEDAQKRMQQSQEEFQRILEAKRAATAAIISFAAVDTSRDTAAPVHQRKSNVSSSSNPQERNAVQDGSSSLGLLHSTIRDLASAEDIAMLNRHQQQNSLTSSSSKFSPTSSLDIQASNTQQQQQEQQHQQQQGSEHHGISGDAIPRSFEEICRMSMESKQQKNKKEKKRGREAEAGSAAGDTEVSTTADSTAAAGGTGSNIDNNNSNSRGVMNSDVVDRSAAYFEVRREDEACDCSVEGTLQFARDVGWLDQESDYQRILEDYEKNAGDQQLQQNDHIGATSAADGRYQFSTHSSGQQQPQAAARRSHEKHRPGSSGHSHSYSAGSGGSGSTQQHRSRGQGVTKAFDYSQVPRVGVHSYTIGTITGQHQATQRTTGNTGRSSSGQHQQQDGSLSTGGNKGGSRSGGRGGGGGSSNSGSRGQQQQRGNKPDFSNPYLFTGSSSGRR